MLIGSTYLTVKLSGESDITGQLRVTLFAALSTLCALGVLLLLALRPAQRRASPLAPSTPADNYSILVHAFEYSCAYIKSNKLNNTHL